MSAGTTDDATDAGDQHKAALFVGTVSTQDRHAPGGAWFSGDGSIMATDEYDTAALAVCPGDELAVQVVVVASSDDQEALVRDLASLEVLERFAVATGVASIAAACRDDAAADVIVAAEGGIYDARTGEQVADIVWDVERPLWLSARIAVGLGQDEGAVAIDLQSGAIHRLDRRGVYAYAVDRDARHVATLRTSSRPGDPNQLTIKRIETGRDDLQLVDVAERDVPANVITRYSADEAGVEPAYLAWLDGRIAYIRGQRADVTHPARGRVMVLDGADLSLLCRSRAWNVPPLATADGTLLGVQGRYRTVRNPPEDRAATVMFQENTPGFPWRIGTRIRVRDAAAERSRALRVPGAEPSGLVVPLPGFDADTLLGSRSESSQEPCT